MSYLHATINARLDEYETDLRLIERTPGLGVDEVDGCTCGTSGMSPYGHEPGCGLEPGPVWTLVFRSLQGIAEDRDILARHYDCMNLFIDAPCCATCNTDDGGVVLYPCPEIRSLARRHGIEVAS